MRARTSWAPLSASGRGPLPLRSAMTGCYAISEFTMVTIGAAHGRENAIQICHRTVAYRPGNLSEVLTVHYRRAHPETLFPLSGSRPPRPGPSAHAAAGVCGLGAALPQSAGSKLARRTGRGPHTWRR